MNVPPRPISPAEPVSADGVVAAGAYVDGRRVANIAISEASSWRAKPGHVVWIGLHEPDMALLTAVQKQFDLHELAIEDANHAHQRPKIEQYGEALFIVARTAQLAEGRIAFGETHIFIGDGYLVTVRHGASTSYTTVRERCESCPRALARGEDYILYAILDFIVDNYSPVLESIHEEVEEIEDYVLSHAITKEQIERLYMLRRDLLRLRNAIGPLVEVCRRLEHDELSMVRPTMQPLFRDVTDHVRNIQERIDSMREVLAFAFEASLLVGQAQETAVSKKLASWLAILAIPTALAGIYGMNFKNMPELQWEYGYYVLLSVMAISCAALYVRFRRAGWL
ncbi:MULTISPECIES: magnesium/cobalt transporter CorA [unclassified Bradyrhizobium]|uniref:magnesium/cobalt transporter CorA n=1 Tax=unclassified Bradyrhizobium TaxID=2631580 RepID=UPI00247A8092|nr:MULTISPECIES: magnesium/cobalt transporter CorA [unclassified Bradyrhizobium]WGR74100.1 magnesium/cobalt transporter CorA [Bradyrhizobium sp. ISRA426]WGR78935.1 magnesium/cobalt transporter CorA [Bradyrhizobium sp. ISRA430]WGR89339.1 magnesium/cobalt transporter CorA [Bradyrhizobium sp. ISRA432]